jgi:hypothetical protein
MENINISIPASDIEEIIQNHILINKKSYAEDLAEVISNNPELLDFQDSMLEALDYDVLSSKVLEEMDDSELASKVQDNLDFYDLASTLRDYLDIPNEIDINDEAQSLLESYVPGNSCGTGNAFTDAIAKAFLHLVEKDLDFKVSVVRGLRDPEYFIAEEIKALDALAVSNLQVTDASNNPDVITSVPNSVPNNSITISRDDFNKIVMNTAKLVTTENSYFSLNAEWLTNQVKDNLSQVHGDKFKFGEES